MDRTGGGYAKWNKSIKCFYYSFSFYLSLLYHFTGYFGDYISRTKQRFCGTCIWFIPILMLLYGLTLQYLDIHKTWILWIILSIMLIDNCPDTYLLCYFKIYFGCFSFGLHLGWIFLLSEELCISLVEFCWWGSPSFFSISEGVFVLLLFPPWRVFSWSVDFSCGIHSLSALWRWHPIDFIFSLLLLRSQFIVLLLFLENNVFFSSSSF